MARNFNKSNPAFEGKVDGVPANHSSEVKSVTPLDHAQSDDALQDVPPPQDPNLSGQTPTLPPYTWVAGALSAWQENDDYREFFEGGEVAESATTHCGYPIDDGDYDDNRGFPTAIGHSRGQHGPKEDLDQAHGTLPNAHEFAIGSVILRRI